MELIVHIQKSSLLQINEINIKNINIVKYPSFDIILIVFNRKYRKEYISGVTMTYYNYVVEYIKKCPFSAPIFVADIGNMVMKDYNLPIDKANAAVAVVMKRIMTRKQIPNLRFFQKGIYYRTEETPFGETGINKELLILRKYMDNDQGYETGARLLYKLGLTTQLPNARLIATNAVKECLRRDEKLNVSVCPPKVIITRKNKDYLQFLDVLEMLNRTPIDVEDPYRILASYIEKKKLRYDLLLALANKYYPQRTILQLAQTAAEKEMIA